jgi:hypothetical protein
MKEPKEVKEPKTRKYPSREETLTYIKRVIEEYETRLTIRQIYYRLVADYGLLNSQNSYKRVGDILGDARLNGEVDFEAIEDRSRELGENNVDYESLKSFMQRQTQKWKELALYYRVPQWYNQPKRVVVMVEKQALQGIFSDVCERLEVDLMVCKGYPSLTLQWELAERLKDSMDEGQELHLIYFGDFDPSGENIPDKLQERLPNDFDLDIESFTKEALTIEQVEQWNLPPAPAKKTDTRYEGFVEKYGVAWQVELDAIKPDKLTRMIETSITRHYDPVIGGQRNKLMIERRQKIADFVDGLDLDKIIEDSDNEEDDD